MCIIYYKVTTGKRQYPAPRIGITIYKNKLSILKGSTVMNCLKFGGLFLKSVLDKGYSSKGRRSFIEGRKIAVSRQRLVVGG